MEPSEALHPPSLAVAFPKFQQLQPMYMIKELFESSLFSMRTRPDSKTPRER